MKSLFYAQTWRYFLDFSNRSSAHRHLLFIVIHRKGAPALPLMATRLCLINLGTRNEVCLWLEKYLQLDMGENWEHYISLDRTNAYKVLNCFSLPFFLPLVVTYWAPRHRPKIFLLARNLRPKCGPKWQHRRLFTRWQISKEEAWSKCIKSWKWNRKRSSGRC